MGRTIGAEPARLRQGSGIPPVGLHPTRPVGIYRRVVRVGDDDLVPEFFQAACDPLTLRGGLHEDLRFRPATKHLAEAMPLSADAHLDQLTVFRQDRDLAFAL